MTVSAQTTANSSTGNGVTTVFPYAFKVLRDADLEVIVDGVTKALTSDYTVSGVGNDAGGNVTFLAAPAVDAVVVRRRNMQFLRAADYQYQGDLPNSVLNPDLDAPVMMAQQLQEQVSRSARGAPGETWGELPAAASRLDKFLTFDDTTGAPEMSTITHTQVASAVAAAYATGSTADAVTYLPASGPSLSVQAHLRAIDAQLVLMDNFINIRAYESLVSGGSWTAAFNQALVDAEASNTRTIYFPYDVTDNNGNYNFDTKPDVIPVGITLRGENPRQFLVRNYAPSGTEATAASSFLVWDGSGYDSDPNQNKGGGMRDLGVGAGHGTTAGTAIFITGTDTANRPGYMLFENIVVSVPNGSDGTWAFGVLVKGQGVTTSGSQGMRDITFAALYIFRCTGDPMQITNGVHIHVRGLTVSDGGAGNSNPTVRVNGGGTGTSNSIQCFLSGLDIEGTVAFTECSYIVAMGYANRIESLVTATNCKFIGVVNTNAAPDIDFV